MILIGSRCSDFESAVLGYFREAIINAVCHRDYLDSGHVQVRWHDDRIAFEPGLEQDSISGTK